MIRMSAAFALLTISPACGDGAEVRGKLLSETASCAPGTAVWNPASREAQIKLHGGLPDITGNSTSKMVSVDTHHVTQKQLGLLKKLRILSPTFGKCAEDLPAMTLSVLGSKGETRLYRSSLTACKDQPELPLVDHQLLLELYGSLAH